MAGFAISLEQSSQVLNYWVVAKQFDFSDDYWNTYSEKDPGSDGRKRCSRSRSVTTTPPDSRLSSLAMARESPRLCPGWAPSSALSRRNEESRKWFVPHP